MFTANEKKLELVSNYCLVKTKRREAPFHKFTLKSDRCFHLTLFALQNSFNQHQPTKNSLFQVFFWCHLSLTLKLLIWAKKQTLLNMKWREKSTLVSSNIKVMSKSARCSLLSLNWVWLKRSKELSRRFSAELVSNLSNDSAYNYHVTKILSKSA